MEEEGCERSRQFREALDGYLLHLKFAAENAVLALEAEAVADFDAAIEADNHLRKWANIDANNAAKEADLVRFREENGPD